MSVGMAVDTVAKKKSTKPAKAEPADRKPMVVQMRGSEEWKAWVEGLAARDKFTIAKLIERAIEKHAKDTGYPDAPRR